MAGPIVPLDPARVRARLAAVRERIEEACARAGRAPADVELLAATKYVPVEEMGALAEAGITLVGESTAQALAAKHARWGDCFTFDFIGHLQSRKTGRVLPLVRLLHSVESESVIRRLDRHAQEGSGATGAELLLEVRLAGEDTKHGVPADAVDGFLDRVSGYSTVSFAGLMAMPPLAPDPEQSRPHFAELRRLGERLAGDWAPRHRFHTLSMGTSQDFAVAVEEGATIVRLGGILYR